MAVGKISFTLRFVLIFGVVLLVANAVLGYVTLNQSTSAMKSLIRKDMLDVVNSAAESLDGDVLGALTEDDVDGPAFLDIEERLLVFQRSVDIHFIYAVKQVDADTYVFTVDPDPVDPGEFGEEVLTTPALVAAAAGTPSVDDAAAADRWGNFYSAYSPVFDSSGKVAGVVGVDFDAEWYDEQVRQHTMSIAFVTSLSVLTGVVVIALITNRVRKRFRELDESLEDLSADVDALMDEVVSYTNLEKPEAAAQDAHAEATADEIESLGLKIRTLHDEMRYYLEYLHMQAYTDALTQLENTTAYHETTRRLDTQIAEGTADFCVAIFDVNSLKELNDTYGHECGDYYIQGAAQALGHGFANMPVFRIGGDEFAVVAEGWDQKRMDEAFGNVWAAVAAFNATTSYPPKLSISQGMARFAPGSDASYADVFSRADRMMYENKRAYYQAEGDRRHRD